MNDYEKALEEAKNNDDVVGFILTGSRGKGFDNEHSDYDAIMVVKDEAAKVLHDKYEPLTLENVDLSVWSLSEFKKMRIGKILIRHGGIDMIMLTSKYSLIKRMAS
jgi:predicted nucleotidyltransferase